MKNDKIRQQEEQQSIKRLREILKHVAPPAKTQPQWKMLENGIFDSLDTTNGFDRERKAGIFSLILQPSAGIPAISAIVVLILLSIGHFFQKHETIPVTAIAMSGKVELRMQKGAGAETLSNIREAGKALFPAKDYSCVTRENSSFIFQVGKECAFEMSPNSNLTIKELSPARMAFDLACGSILVKVAKRTEKQKFEIKTPDAVCTVTGTIFKVEIEGAPGSGETHTILTVYEGSVSIITVGGSEKRHESVSAGHRFSSAAAGSAPVRGVLESETPIKAISRLELLVNEKYSTAAASGLMDVSSQPEEALIMVDDTIVGKSPLVLRKSTGHHKIKVFAQGFLPWEQSFVVGKDSISFFSPSLAAIQMPSSGSAGSPAGRKPGKKRSSLLMKADPESLLVSIPDYVEAMVQFTIGEYQKSLGIFDSLKSRYPLDMKSRTNIMKKINNCYAKIGDFTGTLANLQEKLDMTTGPSAGVEKEQLLWEIANLNANCMGDYEEAELALVDLITSNPAGNRTREAYEKLAEVRFMLNNYDSAAAAYKTLIGLSPDPAVMERSVFSLACILKDNLRHFKEAAGLYSRITDDYPHGTYFKAALFARAECLERLGRMREAQCDYRQCLALDPRGLWSSLCEQRLRKSR
jgi:hypothetical protein